MKKTALLLAITCVAYQGMAHALGVTPYLPLNLDPDIEYQVERVLILGDEPVMTRPIPAALVLEALPKACKVDRPLCERVGHYLDRYAYHGSRIHQPLGRRDFWQIRYLPAE